MIVILIAVTLFCAVLIALDRVPGRYLTGDLVRACFVVRADRLEIYVACEILLFEWWVNGRDFGRAGIVNGMRLMLGCENWWSREIGDEISYRRVVVDSREWSER